MSKKRTKVLIVGGGFGGVKAALNLANKPGFDVSLMSDNTHFEYHGALYRSAVGHSPMEVVIPLSEIFDKSKNVELILDAAGHIDPIKKRVASLTGNIYSYDKLILALGNTVNYFNIKGLEENSVTMNNIPSTIKLRSKLVTLFKDNPGKPVRIAVIGAGPSGTELAAEIPNFAKFVASKYQLKDPRVKVVLIDGADRVLPSLSPKASKKVMKRLNDIGIEVHLNISVQSCKPGTVCLDAGNIDADLIVWTAGSKPVDFYKNNAEIFTLNQNGKVVVDEQLLAQGQEDIYVLGDNADTPYSGMAQTALYDANFVARNLIRLKSSTKTTRYRARKPLYVVTAGPKWAIVQEGNRIISGYRGWTVRRRADLWIFKNFQPYKKAVKTWRQARRMANI